LKIRFEHASSGVQCDPARRSGREPFLPGPERFKQFGLRSAVPRPDRTRTAVNPERNLPVLRKIAIIHLKFRVHPGNPGYTETPLYT
jgi:hypothetical protein